MTVLDGRAHAWLNAEDRLRGLDEFAKNHWKTTDEPLPEWYWANLAVAQVYARLSQVAPDTAYLVGEQISERQKQQWRDESQRQQLMEELEGIKADLRRRQTKGEK